MLRLTLHQFRSWNELQIEAPIGAITLIKGLSGIGKTTIFQAIAWCLYKNLRSVHPSHLDPLRTPTRVILELPYPINGVSEILRIERARNPNRLLLTFADQRLEDAVAQARINDLFGTYEVWMISCYIGQKSRNSFLTASNAGKMDLLNQMAFHEDDPHLYLERIQTELGEKGGVYRHRLAEFTTHLNSFQTFLGTIDPAAALSESDIQNFKLQHAELQKQWDNLKTHLEARQINLGILRNLQAQVTALEQQQIELPPPDPSWVILETEGIDLRKIIPLLEQRDQVESQISALTEIEPPAIDLNFTPEDYHQILAQENRIKVGKTLAEALGVPYDSVAIEARIRAQTDLIEAQDRIKVQNKLQNLIGQIQTLMGQMTSQLPPPPPPIEIRSIIPPNLTQYATETFAMDLSEMIRRQGALQTHIEHLQSIPTLLECPHCAGSVRLQNGILIRSDQSELPLDQLQRVQTEYNVLTNQIQEVQNYIQALIRARQEAEQAYKVAVEAEKRRVDELKSQHQGFELELQRHELQTQALQTQLVEFERQRQELTLELDRLPPIHPTANELLTQAQLQNSYNLIAQLRTLEIIPEPSVGSKLIDAYLQFKTTQTQRQNLIADRAIILEQIPVRYRTQSIGSILDLLQAWEAYELRAKAIRAEQLKRAHLLESYQNQIQSLTATLGDDPSIHMDSIRAQMETLTQKLQLSDRAHQALQWHAQITNERQELVELDTMIADLELLRQHTLRTECVILQEVVDTINAIIEDVCSTLFDREINITLKLDKLLKTTNNLKQEVNFLIGYQGGTYEALSQLSGGEEDRASLALTLALNRLSACPILMLDELLGSLDYNTKDAAIRTIREQTQHTVLVIMHGGVEGIFDAVIDCEALR